jgi:hypothetical protein
LPQALPIALACAVHEGRIGTARRRFDGLEYRNLLARNNSTGMRAKQDKNRLRDRFNWGVMRS